MEKSTDIKQLAGALMLFQSKLDTLPLDRTVKVKTKTGGDYSFKYATYAAIVEYVRPIMHECKLCYSQLVESDGSVTTMLMHESGEYISSNLLIKGEQTPQGIGSAITYAKRYALSSMLGIVADDDDDANIAEGNKYETQEKPWLNPGTVQWADAITYLRGTGTIAKIKGKYGLSKKNEELLKEAALQPV